MSINGLAIASALLCIAVVWLWIRSGSVAFTLKRVAAYSSAGERLAITWQPAQPVTDMIVYSAQSFPGRLRLGRDVYHLVPPNQIRSSPEDGDGLIVNIRPMSPRELHAHIDTVVEHGQGWAAGQWASFEYGIRRNRYAQPPVGYEVERRLVTPFWPIAGLLALFPSIIVANRFRKHARRDRNFCSSCGYDIRATRDRCPECGTPGPDALTPLKLPAQQRTTPGF